MGRACARDGDQGWGKPPCMPIGHFSRLLPCAPLPGRSHRPPPLSVPGLLDGPPYHTPSSHPAVESDECLGSRKPRPCRLNGGQYGTAHGHYGSFSGFPNSHLVAGVARRPPSAGQPRRAPCTSSTGAVILTTMDGAARDGDFPGLWPARAGFYLMPVAAQCRWSRRYCARHHRESSCPG